MVNKEFIGYIEAYNNSLEHLLMGYSVLQKSEEGTAEQRENIRLGIIELEKAKEFLVKATK